MIDMIDRHDHDQPTNLKGGLHSMPPAVWEAFRAESARRQALRDQAAVGKPTARSRKRYSGGRFASVNAFLDTTARSLSRGELLVWLLLWRDAKAADGGTARTAHRDLARRAGLSTANPKQISRIIRKLTTKGLLTIISPGGFRRGAGRYRPLPIAPS